MTASLLFSLVSLALAALSGCGSPARDARGIDMERAGALATVHGDFLADGTCRATVNGAALFAAADAPHSSQEEGAVADIAPAGYELRQIACAAADAAPSQPERTDERMVLVTLYVRAGSSLHAGRYVVHAGVADAGDTTGVASRAGIAIFGARASSDGEARHAGVHYLEGRDGTLQITSVDSSRIVGRFDVHAGAAWSM